MYSSPFTRLVSVNTPLNLHINGHIEESRKSPTDKSDDDDDDGIDDDNLSDDDKSTGETERQIKCTERNN